MKKYLITGFSGFVSKHFIQHLEDKHSNVFILGLDLTEPDFKNEEFKFVKWNFNKVDLMNYDILQKIIYNFHPDYILHLAAFSSVAYSWSNPVLSFQNNTNIFLNLLESIRINKINCRILSVGSSEEYGNFSESDIPLKETHSLNPISPYAVARVSQELLSKIYVEGYGLDIVLTRSFNHCGPGQKDVFVVPSITNKILELKRINSNGTITTGDINIIRDFLDVRDVVNAYDLLFKRGKNGEIYNICSGEGISILEIIRKLEKITNISVDIIQDVKLMRPNDIKTIIGDNTKLVKHTGWQRLYNIDKTLQDIIEFIEK